MTTNEEQKWMVIDDTLDESDVIVEILKGTLLFRLKGKYIIGEIEEQGADGS